MNVLCYVTLTPSNVWCEAHPGVLSWYVWMRRVTWEWAICEWVMSHGNRWRYRGLSHVMWDEGMLHAWMNVFMWQWLPWMCDMAPSKVRRDSLKCVPWPNLCHDSLKCITRLPQMCAMTPSNVCHDSLKCVPWLPQMCAMTPSIVCHDHMCAMTPSNKWLDYLKWVPWLPQICHDFFKCVSCGSHRDALLHTNEACFMKMRTHCNTLQHTATHCNTQQHTATHCNTLQHTATHL